MVWSFLTKSETMFGSGPPSPVKPTSLGVVVCVVFFKRSNVPA